MKTKNSMLIIDATMNIELFILVKTVAAGQCRLHAFILNLLMILLLS